MNKNQSVYLKTITGVVLINVGNEDVLCCLEDMQYSKYFTIGQIFNAIRVLNGKTVNDYGKLWPKFKVDGVVTNEWIHLQSIMNNCDSDYDFLVEVCNQLQEEVPAVVERSKVLDRIEVFKETIYKMVKEA